jgi:hypothetical protein
VIALGRGGATETVTPLEAPSGRPATGVGFPEQTTESLVEAILRFERCAGDLDPSTARQQALAFSAPRFERELFAGLDAVLTPSPLLYRAA